MRCRANNSDSALDDDKGDEGVVNSCSVDVVEGCSVDIVKGCSVDIVKGCSVDVVKGCSVEEDCSTGIAIECPGVWDS